MNRLQPARLYGILDLGYALEDDLEVVTRALIAGGADLIQLRAKGVDPAKVLELGRRVRPVCCGEGVPFIVNDYPEIAVALEADGLHVGQDDGGFDTVRAQVGPKMLLGRSTHSVAQALKARDEGFDYIGFGPLFPTPTKRGRPGIGMEHVAQVEREVGTVIPVFCIGGVKRDNLPQVMAAGARRVVIVSDLLTADDVSAATREAREMLDSAKA
ncbi:MAG: thiamine phosphate synthase [Verrucomicrobiales bacterium]